MCAVVVVLAYEWTCRREDAGAAIPAARGVRRRRDGAAATTTGSAASGTGAISCTAQPVLGAAGHGACACLAGDGYRNDVGRNGGAAED